VRKNQNNKILKINHQLRFWAITVLLQNFCCIGVLGKEKSKAEKSPSHVGNTEAKGLLPEIRTNTENENENDQRSFTSEVLITRTEMKAISALEKIIQRKKGSSEEADLWFRLAELHMRRSKSGRFFDLNLNERTKKWTSFPLPNEKGTDSLRKAVKIYSKIELDFPRFPQMDEVFFISGFAQQQLGNYQGATSSYRKLQLKFPHSPLIADGILALGELYYDHGSFKEALPEFLKIEKFPKSRVYNYGLYKAAWTYYNLNQSDEAVDMLVRVVKANSPELLSSAKIATMGSKQNLRKEALRDLSLFTTDSYTTSALFSFFEKLCTETELGEAMIQSGKILISHSKYKEANLLLTEFSKKSVHNPSLIQAQLLLVESLESMKERKKVVATLKEIADACQPHSDWSHAQNSEIFENSCKKEFRITSLEIAKKWWEIWLKNKQNKEFSALTENALRFLLEGEDVKAPDTKSHYALAELLFQMEQYDEASLHYKITGDFSTEETVQHDADYAALFSLEKYFEGGKNKNSEKTALRRDLALNYLKRHPNGIYLNSVQFNLGLRAYEESNFEEASKWLILLAQSKSSGEFQSKAEDLLLDIANLQKNYSGIQSLSKKILANNIATERRSKIQKILEESSFKEIQDLSSKENKELALTKLIEFSERNEKSPLAKEALWQALSLSFALGKSIQGADLSIKYVRKYPHDSQILDATKEAAAQYASSGMLFKAAETLTMLARMDSKNVSKHLEAAADFYLLERKLELAREVYGQALPFADKSQAARLISKTLKTYDQQIEISKKGTSSLITQSEVSRLEERILSMGLEPYSTEILIKRNQKLFDQGRWKEAFDLSLKINNRSVDKEVRAPARLIQARILERELIEQSVKTQKEDRLALVIGLKTEKFDKAHSAYSSAVQMSKDSQVLYEAFRGLDRCYDNYVSSLKQLGQESRLPANEKSALQSELQKITGPISEKRSENQVKLQQISLIIKQPSSDPSNQNLSHLSVERALPLRAHYPAPDKIPVLLPTAQEWKDKKDLLGAVRGTTSKCSIDPLKKTDPSELYEIAGGCFKSQQWETLQTAGTLLTESKESHDHGLYYLSLAAEGMGYLEKAHYLIGQALKNQNENPAFHYQKARLVYKSESIQAAFPLFEKLFDMEKKSTELTVLEGAGLFAKEDFTGAFLKFSTLSADQIYNLNVGSMVCETFAQQTEIDKALRLADALLKKEKTSEMFLTKAHLLEAYKASPTSALESYKKASASLQEGDLKDWVERKIVYLNSLVGRQVSSGGYGD